MDFDGEMSEEDKKTILNNKNTASKTAKASKWLETEHKQANTLKVAVSRDFFGIYSMNRTYLGP